MRVAKKDENGNLLVRDNLVAVFFCRRPYPELAAAFGGVFEHWLTQTPEDAKAFASIGSHASEYKPFSAKLLPRARAEFDPARAKTRAICSLEVLGPEEINPPHEFKFIGLCKPSENACSVIEIRSPSAEAAPASVDLYLEFVRFIADKVPYDSGYASLALTYGGELPGWEYPEAARRWAFRHPGFDIPNSGGINNGIGSMLRGAYWLTFVGPWALKKLGGEAGLRKALPAEVAVQPVGVGVMLRAGKVPEAGDVNKGQKLPLLRAVAKVLQSVTLFGSSLMNNCFVDEEDRDRWERRHLA